MKRWEMEQQEYQKQSDTIPSWKTVGTYIDGFGAVVDG